MGGASGNGDMTKQRFVKRQGGYREREKVGDGEVSMGGRGHGV